MSLITGNTVYGQGGGIYNFGTFSSGTLTVNNSTVSGNFAVDGAGIFLFSNSTIAGNSATGTGGGIYVSTNTQMHARNTVIAQNTAPTGPDIYGNVGSQGHNLIGNPQDVSGFVDTDILHVNPLLGPLRDNGGPTFTQALLPSSPAIGAGDPTNAPATDQRGFPRVVNGKIDIGSFEVQGPGVSQLVLSAPSNVTAGAPFSVSVTALDNSGNVATSYAGTVTFTSSDPQPSVLPSDYTFTTSDSGTHSFTGVRLFTLGAQTLTAKDKTNNSISGSAAVSVNATSANHFLVAAQPMTVAGTPFSVTVAALDPYGNVDTGYSGTVIFTSSDRNPRPSDYTFTPTDHGVHIFAASLFTAGVQTFLAKDAIHETFAGTATVLVQAAPADHFLMTAPSTATSGLPFDLIVTALDPYGNTDSNYQGTLTFSTSDADPGVVLPSGYTFTTGNGGDNGVHDFLGGVTFITSGAQTLTATDMANGAITGSAIVTVAPGPAPPPGGSTSRAQESSIDQTAIDEPMASIPALLGRRPAPPSGLAGHLRGSSYQLVPRAAADVFFGKGPGAACGWPLRAEWADALCERQQTLLIE